MGNDRWDHYDDTETGGPVGDDSAGRQQVVATEGCGPAVGFERAVEWLVGAEFLGGNVIDDSWICRLRKHGVNQYVACPYW